MSFSLCDVTAEPRMFQTFGCRRPGKRIEMQHRLQEVGEFLCVDWIPIVLVDEDAVQIPRLEPLYVPKVAWPREAKEARDDAHSRGSERNANSP